MPITLENVTEAELLAWMREKIQIDEEEYQEWRAQELKKPLNSPKRRKDHVRGSDFRKYYVCPRRLFWDTHDPVVKRGIINKQYFGAIKKHELMEERLSKRGWTGEQKREKWLSRWGIPGFGHMDALSPSETLFLEFKHNPPSFADELQCSFYQFLHFKRPVIGLVYRTRVVIIPDHSRALNKYMPRVVGTVIYDHLPPRHPSFPKCRGRCDYGPRCGRPKYLRMKEPVSEEWVEWLKKIGADAAST